MKEIIKHMFNHAAESLTLAEHAIGLIEDSVYSKQTKIDIKIHLSHDIVRMLALMQPAFEMMKEEYPDKVEIIERWEKLWEEVNKPEEAKA